MYRSNSARIVPLIILLVVTVALILGLVTVGRYIFGGTRTTGDQEVINEARDELLTVDTERSVVMVTRGPIVGDDEFRTESVNITPTDRTYTFYKGYLEEVQTQSELDNNTPAYEEFVYALDKAELTRPGEFSPEEASDLRGICAVGNVYEFSLYDGDSRLQWYWTSSCKGSPGTLGANLQQIYNLFAAQVPNTDLQYGIASNRIGY